MAGEHMMQQWEAPQLIKLRRELKDVCQRLIVIAKQPGPRPGYEKYEYQSEDYKRLAFVRDKLIGEIVTEWNKLRYVDAVARQGSHQGKPRQRVQSVYTVSGGSVPVI
jgi:hypothetical protein